MQPFARVITAIDLCEHECANQDLAAGVVAALALALQHALSGLDALLAMPELAKSALENVDPFR